MTTFTTKDELIAGVLDGSAKEIIQVEWSWHDGEKFIEGNKASGRKKFKGVTEDSILLVNHRGEESHLIFDDESEWEFKGHRLIVTIPNNVQATYVINPII